MPQILRAVPRKELTDAQRGELQLVVDLLSLHLAAYYASTPRKREEVYKLIDQAWREGRDLSNNTLPGGEWRQAWPEAARNCMLALWSTVR